MVIVGSNLPVRVPRAAAAPLPATSPSPLDCRSIAGNLFLKFAGLRDESSSTRVTVGTQAPPSPRSHWSHPPYAFWLSSSVVSRSGRGQETKRPSNAPHCLNLSRGQLQLGNSSCIPGACPLILGRSTKEPVRISTQNTLAREAPKAEQTRIVRQPSAPSQLTSTDSSSQGSQRRG